MPFCRLDAEIVCGLFQRTHSFTEADARLPKCYPIKSFKCFTGLWHYVWRSYGRQRRAGRSGLKIARSTAPTITFSTRARVPPTRD